MGKDIWEEFEKAEKLKELGYGNIFGDSTIWQLLKDLNVRVKALEALHKEKHK